MFRLVFATVVATLAVAAPASADAVCSLQFDVRFDESGRFTQDGAGDGQCAGSVAGVSLDPGAANPSIAGTAAPGANCAVAVETGHLELRPRRAFEMWAPEHLQLDGDWRAVGSTLSGTLVTGDTAMSISGSIAFAGSCSGAGRLHVQLLLGNERPAPQQQPAAPAEQPAPAAAKPKTRKPRACRRAKSPRAAKRCRRAARRR
jgi:hypothetical protein